MKTLWSVSVAGNEVWRFVVFFLCLLAGLVGGKLLQYMCRRGARLERTAEGDEGKATWWRILLAAESRPGALAAFAVGLAAALPFLVLPSGLEHLASKISEILNVVALGYAIYAMVDVVDYYLRRFSERTQSKVDDILAPLVGKSIRITVAVIVLLNAVQAVMEEDMTTILASLGVGGIAIALAAQDSIRNFFGAFVILGDKPFEIGERIVVDGHDGPVESVGFRSTRIRTLDGHLVTVPNGEMTNRTVRNIGKRPFIKRAMTIGVTYSTPPEKVQQAVDIIKDILDNHEGMSEEFPARVYFNEFSAYSLDIMVIYWYHPPDYWSYMAFAERVNMEILQRFNKEGIEFAFPTQTLHVERMEQV